MKWFKHYSNALSSNKLSEIFAMHDFKGYGRYWRLIELMSEKFNGENDNIFVFALRTLKEHLGFHRNQDLIKFLSSLNQVGIMSHTCSDQVIKIKSDILLLLQSKDYKYEKNTRRKNDPKNKTKNKIKNKNNSEINFDFETLYQKYPIKKGKKKGIDMCHKKVLTQKDYNNLSTAIDNYSVDVEETDPKFIKHFSTFMNCWEDFIDYEPPESSEDEYNRKLIEFMRKPMEKKSV